MPTNPVAPVIRSRLIVAATVRQPPATSERPPHATRQTGGIFPSAMSESAPTLPTPGRLARWRHALSTVNPPAGELDRVSRWLVITRAGVLPMTLTAGAVAGLLAVRHHGFAAGWYALSFAGIV